MIVQLCGGVYGVLGSKELVEELLRHCERLGVLWCESGSRGGCDVG